MFKKIYDEWLNSPKLSDCEKQELRDMDAKEIEFSFGKDLEFGTAGIRGLIGLGTNKINIYVVRMVSQGLADYIKSLGGDAAKRGVAISYDTRRMSDVFAKETAKVLSANGINAFLFDDVHPVPLLSFAVRQLNTVTGVMITASHNPKEYNGYKLYDADGSQMSPERCEKVIECIKKIGNPLSDKIITESASGVKIKTIGKKIDKQYIKELTKLSLSKEAVKKVGKHLKLVYTPIHGSGYKPVTSVLKKLKINFTVVEEQINKDSEYSTVKVPNPEFKETLSMGIDLANKIGADVVFGTDPDSDRLGVAIKDNDGEFFALSGNQTGILLTDYILMRLKESGNLTKHGFIVKSFVSTSLVSSIASDYGVELMETPVGFKFIGEKIKELDDSGKKKYIFGFEESCGYLRGTHCRDKDAVVASMLFAEMVCYYMYIGVSVYQKLCEIYSRYGYVLDIGESKQFSGLRAMEDMADVVDKIRNEKIEKIGGLKVVAMRDYSKAKRFSADGSVSNLDIPKNNAVYFELEKGSFICVRPSGTEPKLKIYYSVNAKDKTAANKIFAKVKADFLKIIGE